MNAGLKARLALVAAALLFSTGGAAIKATSFPPWWIAGLRSAIAVLALLVLSRAARRLPHGREVLVGIAYAATLVLFAIANKLTTSANAIFLQSTAPLYLLLLSPLVLKEPIRARDVGFMAVMAAGLGLVFVGEPEPSATATAPWLGNVLALISGLAWAATVAGLRWLGRERGEAIGATVAGNGLAALASFAACAWLGTSIGTPSATDWALVGYLGIFQIGAAYVLVTGALRHVRALDAALLLLVEPLFNPLWAWLFAAETPSAFAVLGGAAILAATIAKSFADSRAAPARA